MKEKERDPSFAAGINSSPDELVPMVSLALADDADNEGVFL